jgi:hypothetical protein
MRFLALLTLCVGCAGVAADSPLTVSLGLDREATTKALHDHAYCHKVDPPQKNESYPRCDRVGTEWGESWVVATFDNDRSVELRRWERFTDDNRAVERWNQLVLAREKLGPASDEALQALRTNELLLSGTRAVKAFRLDPKTIVAVYLLTPAPPEDANVLERVVYVQ